VAPKGIENNANIRMYLLFLSHKPPFWQGQIIQVLPKIIHKAIPEFLIVFGGLREGVNMQIGKGRID